MSKIKIGIVGYGNLGRGVEEAVGAAPDMELVAVFTRRQGLKTLSGVASVSMDRISEYTDKIDVMILCGGSATDLPVQGPAVLKLFNTVDSFDMHAKTPEYFATMDAVGKESGKIGIISSGWDPGLFSMVRAIFGAFLPVGTDYTFWGEGVSQGHSFAIRGIPGVKKAVQYSIPKKEALSAVRAGGCPNLSTRDKHLRDCYVVAEEGADTEEIAQQIKTMPVYFSDYDTVVTFVTEEEFDAKHSAIPHGGHIFRNGKTSDAYNNRLELSIQLDSNPYFTGSILTACARANYRMQKLSMTGAATVLDIPPRMLSEKEPAELLKTLL